LWILDTCGSRISWPLKIPSLGRQNTELYLNKSKIPLIRGLITLEESNFHVAKMSSSGWHEASCPRVEDLTTRQESFFQAAKITKICSTRFLQPKVSCPLKNLIPRPPKGRTEAEWMLDTFGSMVSLHFSNRIFRSQKLLQRFPP
jgi:hypothetical protein